MPNTKEFKVVVRLYNNRLIKLREEEGLTRREMAEEVGLTYPMYISYENLSSGPLNKKTGTIKPLAAKLMNYHGKPFEYLWPDVVCQVTKHTAVAELSGEAALALTGSYMQHAALPPDELLFEEEKRVAVGKVLATLRPEHQQIIKSRFGFEDGEEETLEECGKRLGVPKEQARQIEGKALRFLRHSSRSRPLVDFVEGLDDD